MSRRGSIRQLACIIIGLLFSTATMALGQVPGELEPNNTCQTAQDVGDVTGPFGISGDIDIGVSGH